MKTSQILSITCVRESYIKLKFKNSYYFVALLLFIMKRVTFSTRLRHHTSINDIRADGHLFFTLNLVHLYKNKFSKTFSVYHYCFYLF